MYNKCDKCFYKDQCEQEEVCEYYDELSLDNIDEEEYIEDERASFMEQWFQYVEYCEE